MFLAEIENKNHKIPTDLKDSEQKNHRDQTEGLPLPHFKRCWEAPAIDTSTGLADRPVNKWEAQKQTLVCRAKCLPTTSAAGEAEQLHVKQDVAPHSHTTHKG